VQEMYLKKGFRLLMAGADAFSLANGMRQVLRDTYDVVNKFNGEDKKGDKLQA